MNCLKNSEKKVNGIGEQMENVREYIYTIYKRS